MRVDRLDPEVMKQWLGGGEFPFPVVLYGAHDAGRLYCSGGLAWVDGRCFGMIDVWQDFSAKSLTLIRWAKRVLRIARQLGETEVFIYRDEHPQSERLIKMLGFELVGVVAGDDVKACKEIYACQV